MMAEDERQAFESYLPLKLKSEIRAASQAEADEKEDARVRRERRIASLARSSQYQDSLDSSEPSFRTHSSTTHNNGTTHYSNNSAVTHSVPR